MGRDGLQSGAGADGADPEAGEPHLPDLGFYLLGAFQELGGDRHSRGYPGGQAGVREEVPGREACDSGQFVDLILGKAALPEGGPDS